MQFVVVSGRTRYILTAPIGTNTKVFVLGAIYLGEICDASRSSKIIQRARNLTTVEISEPVNAC